MIDNKILALKYRPQEFKDLIGQEVMAQTITNAIKFGKTPNAYLLTGIRGVGKTTTARLIAKSLNCLKNLESNKPSKLFDDVYYSPISVKTLSEKINLLLDKSAEGIFNICSNERITKYQFGKMMATAFGYSWDLIIPISIKDIPNLTIRPKDMSLSNHKSVFHIF